MVYAARKRAGQCVNCGRQDERTASGLTMCGACMEKREKWQRREDVRERHNAAQRARYGQLKEDGRCAFCGKPSRPGRVLCAACAARDNERKKRRGTARLTEGET
jgi:NMD protein affecting ribosome stability and mRNA decay